MDMNSLGSQGTYVLPDSNNPRSNYGLSDFDVRDHYAGTAIYNLPFKGNRLKEGYQLAAIMQYQTGNPINIVSGSNSFNGITGIVRPNLVGPVSVKKQQAAGVTNVTYIQNTTGVTTCYESTITPGVRVRDASDDSDVRYLHGPRQHSAQRGLRPGLRGSRYVR